MTRVMLILLYGLECWGLTLMVWTRVKNEPGKDTIHDDTYQSARN